MPANTTVEFIVQAVNGNAKAWASDAVAYQPVVNAPAVSHVADSIPEVTLPAIVARRMGRMVTGCRR